MESLAHSASKQVDPSQLENFHEFLRGYTDIFSKNVLSTNDETYKNLKNLIRKSDIVILRGDKDSSVVIMNRSDYVEKLEGMIEEGVKKGTYKKTEDTTLQDLKKFQDFLYRNFYTYEHYKSMYPHSNQPAKLYRTAKTHKFNNIQEINKEKLKFHPIIDQTGTYSYNTAQVISQYLKPLCKSEFKINDTQSFAVDIKNIQPLQEDEEDISYDMELLFTNIPINETIDYILDQIYNKKKLKPICSKLIFKRLLLKLATEVTFTINNNFFKQTDVCTMGGPLSLTFSDIFMVKMENYIVIPMKPIFYRRYVDDIYSRRKKNIEDSLFKALNSYHKNIKLTIEINPIKFLDTHLHNKDRTFVTKVYRKETKIPAHWSSQIPKRYKRNSIKVDLHRAKNISTNFEEELKFIRNKFIKADFPVPFINNVIKDFKNQQKNVQQNNEEELIIPSYFFEVEPSFLLLKLPYCEKNETKSKDFIRKFQFRLVISWNTRKLSSLFRLKDKNLYPACKIYYGRCQCGEDYVGETIRNTTTRWSEHNNPTHKSEPAQHIKNHIGQLFDWSILYNAPSNNQIRKNLEALFIGIIKPSLNEQTNFDRLTLFRNGIT